MNIIRLKKYTKLQNVVQDPKNKKTMLAEWFEANKAHKDARDLTYCEFPRQ